MKAESSSIISFNLRYDLVEMLNKFSKNNDHLKDDVVQKALESYFEDQRDLEDGMKALAKYKKSKSKNKTISLKKIITKYGLED